MSNHALVAPEERNLAGFVPPLRGYGIEFDVSQLTPPGYYLSPPRGCKSTDGQRTGVHDSKVCQLTQFTESNRATFLKTHRLFR